MLKKLLVTIAVVTMLLAIVPLSSAASDEIQAYDGWIGADSPLYGLKLFFQKFDESLAGNANAKLVRQMAHAEERLSEAHAMGLCNNTGAMEMALNEYRLALQQMNATMDDPAVDEDTYLNMSRQMEKHQNHFRYMVNNSTLTEQSRNRWANTFSYSEQFKNGRPFVYVNDTAYFVPPGQMEKMNWTHVPPGMAKKGYQAPQPTVVDGKVFWPWDKEYNHDYNYSYEYGNGTGINQEPNNYSYNNSYLSPGPHGNGNGNANGNANGNGKK